MFDMYQEIILDHYRNPHNKGEMKDATVRAHDYNPLCGDEIAMYLKINSNKITDVRFSGKGCAISQASASMLTDFVKGKTLDNIKKLGRDDVLKMLGIEISAVRLKCALLSLKVLKVATYDYMGKGKDSIKKEFDF